MEDEQVSIIPLVIILILSGVLVRYVFFSSPTPTSASASASTARSGGRSSSSAQAAAARTREAAVDAIQQMFPHLDRRSILWDLQRTGGNLTATTERILAGRMETPPITFQPPPPPSSPAPGTSGSSGRKAPASKPAEPDLITRYNLQQKVAASASAEDTTDGPTKTKWSSNREERQSNFQRTRDEMILAARRKMEAKIAAEKGA